MIKKEDAIGRKVVYKYPDNGYESEAEKVKQLLELGREYKIHDIFISQSRTEIELEEFPCIRLNSVYFDIEGWKSGEEFVSNSLIKDVKGFDVEALQGQAVRITINGESSNYLVSTVNTIELKVVRVLQDRICFLNPSGACESTYTPDDIISGGVSIEILRHLV